MRDEETGSYWQQVTGTAVAGPLKGRQLRLVSQDELTFALWKKEQPNGTVLAPLPRYASEYEKSTWESEVAKLPTVIHAPKGTLPDRETVFGIVENGEARAFPIAGLTPQSPVLVDKVGGEPIMLVLGPDGKSIRVFSRKINGRPLEFYGTGSAHPWENWALLDADTLSQWSFDGCASSGAMKDRCLQSIDTFKDYWFDWQHYHPHSTFYKH
jgi:hypothetical protein